MRERAARRVVETDALRFLRPRHRIPLVGCCDGEVAALDVRDELVEVVLLDLGVELRVERTSRRAADHRRQPDLGREADRLRHRVHLVEHQLLRPRRIRQETLLRLDVDDDVARQRTDLGKLAAPFWRLEPRVLALLVELLPIRLRADLRRRVLRLRLSCPRMEIALRALILVPRMIDALGEGDGIGQILRLDLREGRRRKTRAEVLDDAVRADQ